MTYEFSIGGQIKLKGNPLPSMNEFIGAQRSNAYNGASFKKKHQQHCVWAIRRAKIPKIKRPVILHYIFYERSTRRDLDNISGFAHKVIQDALVECGVITNDGWKNIKGYTDTFAVDREKPRIIVMIEEV